MSEREAAINANLLLIAGHDSTVNTISNCVMSVLRTPGCLELLQSRPDLSPGHRGGLRIAGVGAILSQPVRYRRHRNQWDSSSQRVRRST